jgi:hypothetical protein
MTSCLVHFRDAFTGLIVCCLVVTLVSSDLVNPHDVPWGVRLLCPTPRTFLCVATGVTTCRRQSAGLCVLARILLNTVQLEPRGVSTAPPDAVRRGALRIETPIERESSFNPR